MKILRYIFVFMIFATLNLHAGSKRLVEKMNYENSYEKALKKGQTSGKPIMMLIGQEGCPFCNKFEVKTLTKDEVNDIIQTNFIPLTLLRDIDSFPEKFKPKGVPTVLFIDPKDEEVFYKSFGYLSKQDYVIELQKAIELFHKK